MGKDSLKSSNVIKVNEKKKILTNFYKNDKLTCLTVTEITSWGGGYSCNLRGSYAEKNLSNSRFFFPKLLILVQCSQYLAQNFTVQCYSFFTREIIQKNIPIQINFL